MYNINDYDRPSVATDIVVFGVETCDDSNKRKNKIKKLKLLLVRRGKDPFCGKYAVAGGFMRKGETVEQAALRELSEEAGVTDPKIVGLGVYSEHGRDPRGWIISCAYIALTNTVKLSTADYSDVDEAQWFDFSYNFVSQKETIILKNDSETIVLEYENGRICEEKLGFDHSQILYDAFKKLQDEISYHDMVFDLMPPLFSISELQQVYEAITLKSVASAGFRRKFAPKIEETEFFEDAAAHRTSKLYRKRDNV